MGWDEWDEMTSGQEIPQFEEFYSSPHASCFLECHLVYLSLRLRGCVYV